jgi:hypothetical protein
MIRSTARMRVNSPSGAGSGLVCVVARARRKRHRNYEHQYSGLAPKCELIFARAPNHFDFEQMELKCKAALG